jgi:hypothetical protein
MVIFCVSPQYLNIISEESREFDFKFQGYGNLEDAMTGLLKTNISEIISFIFVADSMQSYIKDLLPFVRMINSMSDYNKEYRKRFIFAYNSDGTVLGLLNEIKPTNLDIYQAKYEVLTDLFIKRDIFGTALTSYYKPYIPNKSNDNDLTKFRYSPTLFYRPLFSPLFLTAIEDIVKLDNLNDTLNLDPQLDYLRREDEFFYRLRVDCIKRAFIPDLEDDPYFESYVAALDNATTRLGYELMLKYIRSKNLTSSVELFGSLGFEVGDLNDSSF